LEGGKGKRDILDECQDRRKKLTPPAWEGRPSYTIFSMSGRASFRERKGGGVLGNERERAELLSPQKLLL